uniref:Glutamyl-tRNA(Gln) amidotransferase subunit B, mitochondrial n=1 Tax=Schistosoma mansoni TaxID=6183 RepID=A0A3Q0KTW5_SCHMA
MMLQFLVILNRHCLELAVIASIGLNCNINSITHFDRKHYFYTDLPAGYQITQYYKPISVNGYLDYIWLRDNLMIEQLDPLYSEMIYSVNGQSYYRSHARIKCIQIEQDTGKSLHNIQHDCSLIDLNRSDVGLIEIVTEPDFNSSDQTAAFIMDLSRLLRHLKCCNAIGAFGELRVDVNVSIGQDIANQNPRVEIKNISTIHGVISSIDYEIKRQSEILNSGGKITQETRSYDPVDNVTLRMRDKELAQDYRYIPEPNLPSIKILPNCSLCSSQSSSSSASSSSSSPSSLSSFASSPSSSSTSSPSNNQVCIQCIKEKYHLNSINWSMNLPEYKKQILLIEHGLLLNRVIVLIEHNELCQLYELTLNHLIEIYLNNNNNDKMEQFSVLIYAKELSFWITGYIYGLNKNKTVKRLPKVEQLAEFIQMNLTGQVFGSTAVELLSLIIHNDESTYSSVHELAVKHDLILIQDPDQIKIQCEKLINDYPKLVRQYKNGNKKSLKKLVMHLITNSKCYNNSNKFNPPTVNKILEQLILSSSSSSSSSSAASTSSSESSSSSISSSINTGSLSSSVGLDQK